MSALPAILDKIAQIPVFNGVQDVLGFELDDIPTVINNTPVRFISPIDMESTGTKKSRLNFRGDVVHNWSIPDICFFGKVTSGSGFEYYHKLMVTYMANYVVQVCLKNQKLDDQIFIEDWSIRKSIEPYPSHTEEHWFFVVKADLTVMEIIKNE